MGDGDRCRLEPEKRLAEPAADDKLSFRREVMRIHVGEIVDIDPRDARHCRRGLHLRAADRGHRRFLLGVRRGLSDPRIHAAGQHKRGPLGVVTLAQFPNQVGEIAFVLRSELTVDRIVDPLVPDEATNTNGMPSLPTASWMTPTCR